MITHLLLACALYGQVPSSEPSPDRLGLLKNFREEFIPVTPGRQGFPRGFAMGRASGGNECERPVRQVMMSTDFEVARYEVPQDLWQAVMGDNPSRWPGPRNSVEQVSFDEALTFCQRCTEMMRESGLIQGSQTVRLPSEAEWEYVARAGTTTIYSFGDSAEDLGRFAWFTGNAAGNDPPVGAKSPNPWGLYDVHGYLWEWCLDTAHESYQSAPLDDTAWIDPARDQQRVLRGGSWKDSGDRLTSSYRRFASRQLRDDAVGLRCVLVTRP